ncbi:PLP-dependent aminotransferase family protein [Paracoccus sp. 1_MG-2023]|uniref:aminotransferase-like domain-containing protein n=1 Tax=unclassified Paracoccus (in: a-proteobacteria) TaxID=2688777 RepID=UPI001C09688B|nr:MULTISPECIES: PLP-dependent aminotransferase family protein [unclassified Paracoccus (in: a-proteobacteria)]MBU2958814.1 PLP-dependent aminotransferase family protein [Paracoccus sp. C2R09]MDO6667807.1 PLP-dependent aminotransferase family protein [Paracoccus sp. 1_MG-2023]
MGMRIEDWDPDLARHSGPKFKALANALREAARSGELAPGTRLPPMRDLAWRLKVTTGTVARAYQLAATEGVVESHVGRGSFIAAPRSDRPAPQPLLYESVDRADGGDEIADLRVPRLPDLGQSATIGRILAQVAAEMDEDVLDYTPLRRDLACREILVDWMAHRPVGGLDADDLVLTNGGQHAITLVMSLALADRPGKVMVESLTYPGIVQAARLMRTETLAVAMDDQGMIPADLERVTRESGARLICLTPSAQNPTLASMGHERRSQIVAIARRHDLQIIEDECYAPSRHTDALPTLRMLAPERVWHVASLSKVVAAGLRFGMMICPEGMGQSARIAAQHSHMGISLPILALVRRLIEGGEAARIAHDVLVEVEDRRWLALDMLGGLGAVTQPGVPLLWLPLPAPWRAEDFVARAAASGVILRPASDFRVGSGKTPEAVRISLNCRQDRARLAEALATIAQMAHSGPDIGPE